MPGRPTSRAPLDRLERLVPPGSSAGRTLDQCLAAWYAMLGGLEHLEGAIGDFKRWRDAARRLEFAWGADTCTKDPTHVWRVPDTTNWPNAKKREAGRVAETAIICQANHSVRYDPEDFEGLELPAEPDTIILYTGKKITMP